MFPLSCCLVNIKPIHTCFNKKYTFVPYLGQFVIQKERKEAERRGRVGREREEEEVRRSVGERQRLISYGFRTDPESWETALSVLWFVCWTMEDGV